MTAIDIDVTRSAKTEPVDPIAEIRWQHKRRRFAMKGQQKLDRQLESFFRVNVSEWSPNLEESDREKINKEVKALIKRIRTTEQSEHAEFVLTTDIARKPYDDMRTAAEKLMAERAMELPVYAWIEAVHGAGALGLATIVAEAGDLSNFEKPSKLWKRLGFAPYDGFAGSTWKRTSWRPRTLTSEEWIEAPFAGERYALMHQIVIWLVNAQWIGKAKTENGEGKADGPYGEIYAKRREHTKETHPDWTDLHRRMDALRITMKAFLKDLLEEWHARTPAKPKPKPPVRTKPKGPAKTKRSRISGRTT